jgi:leader peptidase (prepilin peptidase) / N-methyltransferase
MFWIFTVIYLAFLLGAIVFDLKTYTIPNWLTLPAIAVFFVFCLLKKAGIGDILLRVASTGGVFFLAGLATSYFLKKETIGGGDIKLITAIGLFKGWQDGLFIMFFSALSALISVLALVALKKRRMEDRIPFGFFIGLCGILYEGVKQIENHGFFK